MGLTYSSNLNESDIFATQIDRILTFNVVCLFKVG
jgi:hypothetical protein